MNSHLYVGEVRHRRFLPRNHDFAYKLFMVYLDLDEIDQVFDNRWFWSSRRPNLAWFRRKDYLGGDETPLIHKVRQVVVEAGGPEPRGPVRMLTHLRYFGYCFNPVTFYYCFDPKDRFVQSIVAEITNTPWKERKAYVLIPSKDEEQAKIQRFCFPKSFHVSPFIPMNIDYDWRFSRPDPVLNVHMNLKCDGSRIFDATLTLHRKPLNAWHMGMALLSFPPMTLKVIAGIYWEALLLKLKGVPVHEHPDHLIPRS